MTPTEVERELLVDMALRWGTGYDTVTRSFVNVIATPKGGTHVTGFERALVRTLNEQLRAARLLKNGDEPVTKEDVLEGLTAVIGVRLPEPQFEGQTKEMLGTPAASRIVAQVVAGRAEGVLRVPGPRRQAAGPGRAGQGGRPRPRRGSPPGSTGTTSAARTPWPASALPPKLVDCRSADDRSELFIVEGDSALGTAKLARNSEFQALLPIRGKILNVQKASLADMLKNAECADIIRVIGAGSGGSFDLDSARYQRVIFMSDADVDGAHIRMPAADPVPPVPAAAAGRRAGVRRGAAAAPDRAVRPAQGPGPVPLHLLRQRTAPHPAGAGAPGAALEGADPAVQGPGRDGRRPAGRDHHGPAAPHAAPDPHRATRPRPAGSSTC